MASTAIESGTTAKQGSPNRSSCLADFRCLEIIKNVKLNNSTYIIN